MNRYGLREDRWERIKDFLPDLEGHIGGTAKDNRLFVDAILYRYRAGAPKMMIETFFAKFKQYQAIPTRYDKTACNSLRQSFSYCRHLA